MTFKVTKTDFGTRIDVKVKNNEDVAAAFADVPEPMNSYLQELVEVTKRHKIPVSHVITANDKMATAMVLGIDQDLSHLLMEVTSEMMPALREFISEYYSQKKALDYLFEQLFAGKSAPDPTEVN